MVCQFARSACSPGGNWNEANCGSARPCSKFAEPVVGDARMPLARLCSAVGSELISCDSCVPTPEPLAAPACETAAACIGTAAIVVVCGGSGDGVRCGGDAS